MRCFSVGWCLYFMHCDQQSGILTMLGVIFTFQKSTNEPRFPVAVFLFSSHLLPGTQVFLAALILGLLWNPTGKGQSKTLRNFKMLLPAELILGKTKPNKSVSEYQSFSKLPRWLYLLPKSNCIWGKEEPMYLETVWNIPYIQLQTDANCLISVWSREGSYYFADIAK